MNDSINWFDEYHRLKRSGKLDPNAWFACPCCGYPTKPELGAFDICTLCDWEDDGLEYSYPIDFVIGGPNDDYSIKEARSNFEAYGCMYRPEDSRFRKEDFGTSKIRNVLEPYRWKNNVILPAEAVTAIRGG
jgi:hypothetical protein